MPHECYFAVIERDDGTTYTQCYREFEDLQQLLYMLGDDYLVCDIY